MAYISQDQKKVIASELKKVMPKSVKWTLSIRDHSMISLNIKAVPSDFKFSKPVEDALGRTGYIQLRAAETHDGVFADDEMFKKVVAAMNLGNYDRSDAQRDHHDVGFYTRINLGAWDRKLIRE